jgi:adenylate cyclase class IV
VLNLGDFIEIELIKSTKNMDIEKEKANILTFIKEISNSEVEKIEGGYPWLLWNKS